MHFNDLPLEIIQYVFTLCCRSAVTFTIPQRPDRRRSETTQETLSLVCSRWRAITLNTRELWSNIVVIYDADRERTQGPTTSFQFVQDWLNRSGVTPISLSISVYDALESQIAAISKNLLSLFHVTKLDLRSYHSFLLVPTNSSSRLEILHLALYEPARVTNPFPRLPEMPSLREVHIYLHPGNFIDLTNIYLIPWHQLRVFTLNENLWSSEILFNILQQCTSLVKCTLLVLLEFGQHEHNIILPNLESLVLDMHTRDSANPIIRSLTLPNLRSLDIRCWGRYRKLQLSPDTIIAMAQRSEFNKHLTDFSLCLMEQPVDVRSLLGSMPALKNVQLLGPLMFQLGTFNDLSSGTIGPQLEEVYFGTMSDEEIRELLETVGQRHDRAKTVTDIRPFAFVTGHCTSESDFESHKQRAKQCGEAFNAHVSIDKDRFQLPEVFSTLVDWDADFDFSTGSDSDEELGSITIPGLFVSDEEPIEDSNSGEESHSFGESESHEDFFEDSSSESHWESDPDVSLDSHSGEESDA